MKILKKVLGIIVFWGIGIFLFVTISYLLRPVNDDFFRERVTGFYAEDDETLDIVTTGSSAMYFYFNNPYLWGEFGLTSYNFATPSQSNFLLEDLVDEVLKTQSPQLFVVETRKMILAEEKSLNSNRFTFVHDNMKYSWNRIELINSLYDTWPERFSAYLDILTYHDSWEEFTEENLQFYDNERAHELKGWKNYKKVTKIKAPVIEEGTETAAISEVSEKALIQFMNKCKEENIQVLFLATPWKIGKENQKKNRYLGELIESYGFQFLDCNLYFEEIGLDVEHDFYNKTHTNMVGAEKVTKFVGNYILEHYDLNLEHSAEVTENWNRVLDTYNTQAEEIRAGILSK